MKNILVVVSLVFGLASGVMAEESEGAKEGVPVMAGDGCATAAFADLELGPAADAQPLGLCPASFCSTNAHCQSACPSAQSALCVNSVCQYTFSGGGGSGGPSCPQSFCSDLWDCWNACPQANGVDCVGSVCQYW